MVLYSLGAFAESIMLHFEYNKLLEKLHTIFSPAFCIVTQQVIIIPGRLTVTERNHMGKLQSRMKSPFFRFTFTLLSLILGLLSYLLLALSKCVDHFV